MVYTNTNFYNYKNNSLIYENIYFLNNPAVCYYR